MAASSPCFALTITPAAVAPQGHREGRTAACRAPLLPSAFSGPAAACAHCLASVSSAWPPCKQRAEGLGGPRRRRTGDLGCHKCWPGSPSPSLFCPTAPPASPTPHSAGKHGLRPLVEGLLAGGQQEPWGARSKQSGEAWLVGKAHGKAGGGGVGAGGTNWSISLPCATRVGNGTWLPRLALPLGPRWLLM